MSERTNKTHFLEIQAAMPPYPASIVKIRQDIRSKERTQNKAPGMKWSEVPPVSNHWEKKLNAVTKQLEAFTSQEGVPPHMESIQQTLAAPAPFRDLSFKCYYCF
ncbi:hypothetical protein VP01_3608g2 [Puccinia sorghi]|uniref:Uncharacterized protein n=1 Tax=Puccinia sorghi TaxID=27349 RepID=A0A0L6UVV3_9BASI|nr:hypothetical protein VP01_3608g2 [Puccinia sorghi]